VSEFDASPRPLISAHRGGPEGIHRPNSLEAIRAAVGLGIDLVEFDVRRAPDGSFVIVHDVHDALARRGERPASLRAALEAIQGSRTRAHVDLKETGEELAIAQLCERYLGSDGFFLTTTEDESVRVLRTKMPHLSVALSLGKVPPVRAALAELFPGGRIARCSPTMLAVNHRLARAGLLRWAHERGLRVLAWTVNSPRLIRWANEEPRLWAFTTDRPRYALALRAAKTAA
jgi:glycerophosphoryl diester phosphodiesterase